VRRTHSHTESLAIKIRGGGIHSQMDRQGQIHRQRAKRSHKPVFFIQNKESSRKKYKTERWEYWTSRSFHPSVSGGSIKCCHIMLPPIQWHSTSGKYSIHGIFPLTAKWKGIDKVSGLRLTWYEDKWGSGVITPHSLNPSTTLGWVVSFTTRPLYPWRKSPAPIGQRVE
jgi:hypothetical protein